MQATCACRGIRDLKKKSNLQYIDLEKGKVILSAGYLVFKLSTIAVFRGGFLKRAKYRQLRMQVIKPPFALRTVGLRTQRPIMIQHIYFYRR